MFSENNIYTYLLYIQRQVSLIDDTLEDITKVVIEELTTLCAECDNDIIDNQSFVCFPESPTSVTYRARLKGTSETDSGSLISLIEKWVSGGASIIVTGVLMTVDSECSVTISSLSEGECFPITSTSSIYTLQPTPGIIPVTTSHTMDNINNTDTQTPSTDSNMDTETLSTATDQGSSDTAAIVRGVVAVVIVLIIAITVIVIVIVAFLMKSRRGDLSIKNTGK